MIFFEVAAGKIETNLRGGSRRKPKTNPAVAAAAALQSTATTWVDKRAQRGMKDFHRSGHIIRYGTGRLPRRKLPLSELHPVPFDRASGGKLQTLFDHHQWLVRLQVMLSCRVLCLCCVTQAGAHQLASVNSVSDSFLKRRDRSACANRNDRDHLAEGGRRARWRWSDMAQNGK